MDNIANHALYRVAHITKPLPLGKETAGGKERQG